MVRVSTLVFNANTVAVAGLNLGSGIGSSTVSRHDVYACPHIMDNPGVTRCMWHPYGGSTGIDIDVVKEVVLRRGRCAEREVDQGPNKTSGPWGAAGKPAKTQRPNQSSTTHLNAMGQSCTDEFEILNSLLR